jgi:hypothetical protein
MSGVPCFESCGGSRLLQAGASLAVLPLVAALLAGGLEAAPKPDFGPNVLVFSSSLPAATMQQQIDNVWEAQGGSEFGPGRYALLFLPGTYKLDVPIGYYTQVLGLGASPDQVHITGNVKAGPARGNGALVTFWRAAEGFSVTPAGGTMQWAVSQADPFRRMHITGDLVLHQNNGYASGGWMADDLIDGKVSSGPQQQWIARNTEWGAWNGGNWNMVFVGDANPPAGSWPDAPVTTVAQVPVVREKPFLQVDASGTYSVRVPSLRTNSSGITWHGGSTPGKDIPLSRFYIARPETDTAASINAQLAKGKHLLLTPGIYHINDAIKVTRADAVVLGLGFATLVPDNGTPAMTTADADGIIIAGVLFDAGAANSPVMLEVGPRGSKARHKANPISLHDLFFRVGGAAAGRATVNLRINSHDVILDHSWIWRADHGQNQSVGWTVNTSANGLVVNGDDVTAYGLFVEHLQQYQVVWNGNGGRVYFYQSEIPYDPPDQPSYTSAPGANGWASYKVADNVTSHEAWGLGVYSVFRMPNVILTHALEVPVKPDVRFHNIITICLAKNGEITHIINDTGPAATPGHIRDAPRLTEFPPAGRRTE